MLIYNNKQRKMIPGAVEADGGFHFWAAFRQKFSVRAILGFIHREGLIQLDTKTSEFVCP
jgi:hypothetical protein